MIDIILLVTYITQVMLTGWIFGACIGMFIGKVVTCASGYSMREIDEADGTVTTYQYTFIGAWKVMNVLDEIKNQSYERHTLKP